ncbi:MAG: hypothetical protein FJZ47_22295 [Candidatus Tectomicrobia bacterium]|uniref:Uncharacterized protein n=1 Tax=Tectimicrobiota bacterium TaxID=2528274 RepID=A0A937W695_UNCTE|nr:hypothetical protein [Candidatus Tectomicrobia bacterium]
MTLYGHGKVVRVDPAAMQVTQEYTLPGGPKSGPYAVTVDGAGLVWANAFATDTIVRLNPQDGTMRPFTLPAKGVGVRKMIVDATGRLVVYGQPQRAAGGD